MLLAGDLAKLWATGRPLGEWPETATGQARQAFLLRISRLWRLISNESGGISLIDSPI
jgi:hypothetical protein